MMDQLSILQELETLAAELNVEIRYEALEGPGGLCKYGDRTCIIANRSLAVNERVHLLSRELARFPVDDLFMVPRIRELLESRIPRTPAGII